MIYMYLWNDRVKSQLNGCQDKVNPLKAELNPICHLLALLGAHLIFHVSRIRVNLIKTLLIQVYCDLISTEFPTSVFYLSCPLSLWAVSALSQPSALPNFHVHFLKQHKQTDILIKQHTRQWRLLGYDIMLIGKYVTMFHKGLAGSFSE
jgi:hypothetical protein